MKLLTEKICRLCGDLFPPATANSALCSIECKVKSKPLLSKEHAARLSLRKRLAISNGTVV